MDVPGCDLLLFRRDLQYWRAAQPPVFKVWTKGYLNLYNHTAPARYAFRTTLKPWLRHVETIVC